MKRLLPLLLLALLLTGCGDRTAAPSDGPLCVSMEAEGVTGRSYALDVPLPETITPMEQGGEDNVWKAAETPDGRAAMYNLDSRTGSVLLSWDGHLASFDNWWFQTPRRVDPCLALIDLSGDGEADTLAAILYDSSGTGVSRETLHLVTMDEFGTMTDYALPAALYEERLAEIVTVKSKGTAGTLSVGDVALNLPDLAQLLPDFGAKYPDRVLLRDVVSFDASVKNGKNRGGGGLFMTVAIGVEVEKTAPLVFVGDLLCSVQFDPDTGVYTLYGFAPRGY